MKIIFIDESEYNYKKRKEYFVLSGIVVDEEKLLELEEEIRELKEKNGIQNLKELRKTITVQQENKLKFTKKIVDLLKKNNCKNISIIFGDLGYNYDEDYFGAITFIIERFCIKLRKEHQIGMIICDSLPSKICKNVSSKLRKYLLKEKLNIRGISKGYFKEHIYPAILFLDDDYSEMLQVTDLICTSLQSSLKEFYKYNDFHIKGNEDVLKEYNPYLKCYWELFDKDSDDSVSSWGIKTWS